MGTPSNLEGELWLLLNLIDLSVEKELKTESIKLEPTPNLKLFIISVCYKRKNQTFV